MTDAGVNSNDLARAALVAELQRGGELSAAALAAISAIPRHEFVPARLRPEAYENHPLPIGDGQTISQPFMVGWLADAVGAGPGRRILEIGTGCGYQAAVMHTMGADVFSIEIRPGLARRARARLDRLGLATIRTRVGDGRAGWPEAGSFDGIVLTAAPKSLPMDLTEQLGPDGVMVAPVGPANAGQELLRVRRGENRVDWVVERLGGVRFVPLVSSESSP